MNNLITLNKKNSSLLIFKSAIFIVSFFFILGSSSCIKEPIEVKDENEYGTLWINNKSYLIVKIGEQWWMAEDLAATIYNDGTAIPEVLDNTDWANQKQGARYGNIYNWYALTKLTPPGWHVPSDTEWKTMEEHVGMDNSDANKLGWRGNDEGNKLKMIDNGIWSLYDENTVWGTNESGFGAQPATCRMFDGSTVDDGGSLKKNATSFYWTSTEGSVDTTAYYRHLDYKKANIFRHYGSKNYGFQVRLVKDY